MKKSYSNSQRNSSSLKSVDKTSKLICLFLFFMVSSINAATYYSRQTGNWNTNTTWSLTSGGGAVDAGKFPVAGDVVNIEVNHIVSLNANAACASVIFPDNVSSSSNSELLLAGFRLDVSGDIILPRADGSRINILNVGVGALNVGGKIEFVTGGGGIRHKIIISTGSINVLGSVVCSNSSGTSPIIEFLGSGILNVKGDFFPTGSATLTTGFGTINLNGVNQILGNFAYNNLFLSGTGIKRFLGVTTVAGNLSIGTGVVADLGLGLTHTAGRLTLAGAMVTVAGTWGGASSPATNKNSTYFNSNTGVINVSNAATCVSNLISNGDFNTHSTNWTYATTQGSYTEINPENTYFGTSNPNNTAELDVAASLRQVVTVVPGVSYTVSFLYARRSDGGSPTTRGVTVKITGGTTFTSPNLTTTSNTPQIGSFTFTPTSSSIGIEFYNTIHGGSTLGTIIDDIILIPTSQVTPYATTTPKGSFHTLTSCAGAPVQLDVDNVPTSGVTYVWTGSAGAVFSSTSIKNPTVTFTGSGMQQATVTATAGGCSSSPSTTYVNVIAAPTISGTPTVCVGSNTALTGSGTPDGTTPWSSATPAIATVSSSGVVTGVAAGTSVITYKNNVGCTQTVTVTVNVRPSPPMIGTRTQPNCTISTGSVDLSGLPASGTWTLVATPGGATTTGTGTTATITGLPPNTYTFIVVSGICTSPSSANVVINSAVTTTWNGSSWNNGVPTSTTAAIINGNYSASSNGDINACSLTINSGFKLTIEAGKFVIIQNNLTVAAGATLDVLNIGSLVMINDAPGMVSGTGTTIVRKTTTPTKKLDYVYWSSPVTTTTIGSTFWNWRTDRAFEYNNGWVYATTMNPAKGYIITAPNAGGLAFVDFQGQVNNGIQKITGVTASNFYLIGNPYPSAIDANAFLNHNSGALDGTLYFWTHNTAIQLASGIDPAKAGSGAYAFTSDDYASYNLVGGVGTGYLPISGDAAIPSKSSKPSGAIPSCQGFFASTKASISSTEIVFNNAMRLGSGATKLDNSNFFRTKNTTAKTSNTFERHRIWLNLTNKGGAFKQTLVGYVTEATNENETRFDGETMDGNSFIDFYSVNENKNLVIQGRALPFDDTDEVPLGFKSSLAGEFNISIDEVDGLLANQSVFLEDKLTNTEFDLKKGNFTFSTAAGTFNNRFVLKYKKTEETLGTGDFDTQQNKVIVSVKNKQIKINSFSETIDKVVIYDLSGKLINQKNNINSNEFLVSDFVLNHQALIVKTTLQNGIIVTDKVVY